MKYKCEMIKDLMPLCLDHAAAESSEQAVIEHMAECKECTQYYDYLSKELEPLGESEYGDNRYVQLAAKIRKRRTGIGVLIGILVWVFYFICMNYASGYRLNSEAAAELSGRLNDKSKLLGCFEWKEDYHFYIYDNYSCYDVVNVEKKWNGWKKQDNCFCWPKWSMYDENVGIEVVGDLCCFRNDEGVQLFPIIAYDEKVKSVEVTCYEQTQTKEVEAGEFILFTFGAINGQSNDDVEATAYDEIGNALYRLEIQNGMWVWVSTTE
ncbi:MAG: zf-HC2 domain-containing protein [Coprococcus sp.]